MARPTGTPPPSNPPTANYELPPLPPSPDDAEQQASQIARADVRRQGGNQSGNQFGNKTQQQSDKDAQQKNKGGPQMKQPSSQQAQQPNPQSPAQSSRPPNRARTSSMVSMMVSNWDTGAPSSTRSGQGAGNASSSTSSTSSASSASSTSTTVQPSSQPEVTQRSASAKAGAARRQLGHARMASSPVSPLQVKPGPASGSPSIAPYVPSKPPSDPPPPLVLPKLRSDVPSSPAQLPKVPPLSLAALGTAASPTRVGPARGAPSELSMAAYNMPVFNPNPNTSTSTSANANADRSSPVKSPASLTPTSPRSPVRSENSNVLQGKDVKLELRFFIDGVLDRRITPGHPQFAEQLGELLVYVQSRGGKAEIGSDARNSVLRGTLKITKYTTTSGVYYEEVNVIKDFSQPFVSHLLTTGESEEVRLKLMRAFDKVAEKVNTLSQQGDDVRTSDLLKNEEFITLMQPIVQIFMDYVCGIERTLASSRLPEPMKKLLLTIDKHLILWFEVCGTELPKHLLLLRQNAQVGFIATRSVTAVWRNRCDEELGLDASKKYAKMFAYLNACASNNLGDFVLDIISNQRAQPAEARAYVRAIQSPKQLTRSKGTTVVMPGSDNSVLRRGKTLHATSLLISPRGGSSDAPTTSRTDPALLKLKKEEMKHQLERAKFAEQIISEAGLKALDPRFMQHLKDKIVDMSRRGFDNFKLDPIPYCLQYAKDFYKYGGNLEKVSKDVPAKVEQQLTVLSESFRVSDESEADSDQGTTVTATTTSNVAAPASAGSTTSSTTFVNTNVSNAGAVAGNTLHDDDHDSSVEVSSPSSGDTDWGSDWSSEEQ